MSAAEQSTPHVSLSIPTEQPATPDNFQFMSDTFTLPQDGPAGSTQVPLNQGSSE